MIELETISPEASIDSALTFVHLEPNQLSVLPFVNIQNSHSCYALLDLVTLVSSLTRLKHGTIQ